MLTLLDEDKELPPQIMQEKLADRARLIGALMACSSELVLLVDPGQRRLIDCNELALRRLELVREAMAAIDLATLLGSAALQTLLDLCNAGWTEAVSELDARCLTRTGEMLALRLRVMPVQLDGAPRMLLVGTEPTRPLNAQDITESWRNQLLLDARNRVLEQLARGRPLSEILETLTTHIEALEPSMLCTVLLFDEENRRLFAASASSLPRFYTEAVDGIEVHAELGSCGAAACTGQRIVVADILSHPYWAPFRELIARTELRACWSEPICSADGRVLGTFAMYFREIREPTAPEIAVIASAADLAAVVIEHRRAETALRAAEEQARLLLESTTEGIFGLDPAGIATFINPAAAEMLGYAPNELIGRNLHPLIHHSDADGAPHSEQDCRLLAAPRHGQAQHVDDEVFWRRDGGYFPVEYQATPIRRQGQLAGAVITFHDITERHRTEREIQYLAFHDPLTGLPNRVLFAEELSQTLARLRSRGERFALHLMDVDHFKDVNDSLGHPIGDQLLCSIANRVTEVIRGADIFARLGGDEFGVIQTAIHSPADASLLAGRIIESMGADFNVEGISVRSNTSIGIVVVDDAAGIDAADLLSRADVALYKAKEAGRGVYAFFEDAMTIQLRREMELTRHLSGAVERDELYLEYQPQIDVVTGRLRGVEALLRWRHPVQGLTPPAEFIPVAEKRGCILDISDWVLTQAFTQAALWHRRQLNCGRVAVNLSAVQVRDPAFQDRIEAKLRETGVPPQCIELELTETVLIDATPRARQAIARLSEQGINFAVDDFGTGFSSLTYLRRFQIDKLKIDRDLLSDICNNADDAEIVKATLALAKALGLATTAEGIETEAQMTFLRTHGCDLAQGFLIGRPMSAARIETML